MKILWIFPELPYPLTSGLLRGFHLLRLLGQRHAVSFLSLTDQKQIPPDTIVALKPYTERIMTFSRCSAQAPSWLTALARLPILGSRVRTSWDTRSAVKEMKEAAHSLLEQEAFDILLFQGREALPVLEGVKIPIVVECGDTHCTRILQQMRYARLLLRPRLFLHYMRMRRSEERLARKTPYRYFISERDRENLLGPYDRSEIVPQGIDYAYWKRTSPRPGRNCIVFSGVMNYPPNADAAIFLLKLILPAVRRVAPELEVLIVGREPAPELVNLARHYHDVTVTGAVDDIRPYLERADVFVAPLRFASGVQNKVLEAMAMEIPVVTTPVVASGLRAENIEPQLVLGCSAEEIAAGIIYLLSHADEQASRAAEGRRFVEAHCSWSHSAEKLEKLCLAAAAGRGAESHQPGSAFHGIIAGSSR
ncbi:glycosyltransferase [Edaphobacter bradus]|uniref:glycosyltransferase n=1 Tax=Edaphobacter bradus TaxID=2259016 RepID=UPI0021E0245F|nr:glycosyltransferase [Edaphobacter bradus]